MLNKKAPEGADDKVIAWAFLCASANINPRGGVDVIHLYDKFTLSDLPGLALVFRVCVPLQNDLFTRTKPYTRFADFLLTIHLKTDANEEIKAYPLELFVDEKILQHALGEALSQPGIYTVEIRVDGFLEHSLRLTIS